MPNRKRPAPKRWALLDAARAEIAEHGIAGARVERIANAAGCSPALLYRHFNNKAGLVAAVYAQVIDYVQEVKPGAADDLPEYAALLFDGLDAHPELARAIRRYLVEQPQMVLATANPVPVIEAIAAAQQEGRVTNAFGPAQILALMTQVAWMWTDVVIADADVPSEQRRAAVVEAARRIVAP